MRKRVFFAAGALILALLAGCGSPLQATAPEPVPEPVPAQAGGMEEGLTNLGIPAEDIREFYYTYENINYNAEYLRYRFYTEDGKHLFFHDHRQVTDDYGPAGEEDRISWGTVEVSDEEWEKFLGFLREGTVVSREEFLSDGDEGPWLFLYWEGDGGDLQQFSFASCGDLSAFEEFCRSLSEEAGEGR